MRCSEQFIEFGRARNTIIHAGGMPEFAYSDSNSAYDGPFTFTAEFLPRGVIKVLISDLGYRDAWRGDFWREINAVLHDEEGTGNAV